MVNYDKATSYIEELEDSIKIIERVSHKTICRVSKELYNSDGSKRLWIKYSYIDPRIIIEDIDGCFDISHSTIKLADDMPEIRLSLKKKDNPKVYSKTVLDISRSEIILSFNNRIKRDKLDVRINLNTIGLIKKSFVSGNLGISVSEDKNGEYSVNTPTKINILNSVMGSRETPIYLKNTKKIRMSASEIVLKNSNSIIDSNIFVLANSKMKITDYSKDFIISKKGISAYSSNLNISNDKNVGLYINASTRIINADIDIKGDVALDKLEVILPHELKNTCRLEDVVGLNNVINSSLKVYVPIKRDKNDFLNLEITRLFLSKVVFSVFEIPLFLPNGSGYLKHKNIKIIDNKIIGRGRKNSVELSFSCEKLVADLDIDFSNNSFHLEKNSYSRVFFDRTSQAPTPFFTNNEIILRQGYAQFIMDEKEIKNNKITTSVPTNMCIKKTHIENATFTLTGEKSDIVYSLKNSEVSGELSLKNCDEINSCSFSGVNTLKHISLINNSKITNSKLEGYHLIENSTITDVALSYNGVRYDRLSLKYYETQKEEEVLSKNIDRPVKNIETEFGLDF